MGVPTYPARPPFFAMRFVRAMVKTCVATEHGADVFALLTIVATTEDAAHYRRPVVFLNDQLASVCGLSLKQLIRVRGRAVAAGWLHYVPGRRGVAPRYWVTIPDHAADLDDLPTDEGDDEIGRAWAADSPPDCCPIDAQNGTTIGHQSGINRASIGHQSGYQSGNTYIPMPDPVPDGLNEGKGGTSEQSFDPLRADQDARREFEAEWAAAGLGGLLNGRLTHTLHGLLRSALNDPDWPGIWREAVRLAGKDPFYRDGVGRKLGRLDPGQFLQNLDTARQIVTGVDRFKHADVAPARSPPAGGRRKESLDDVFAEYRAKAKPG